MKKSAFTLIELLVVVAIIGILAALLMVNFIGVRERGRDSQRKSDLKQIQSALELYRADNNFYPTTGFPPSCGSAFVFSSSTYMQKFPCDPLGGSYSYGSNGTSYCLRACLENSNDPQKDASSPSCPVALSDCSSPMVNITVQNP